MSKRDNGSNGSAATASPKAKDKDAKPASPPAPLLPMLYKRVEFLNAESHGKLRYQDQGDFSFAATANYVPLTAMEFGDAAPHTPIVFAGAGEGLEAVAITGRNRGENQQIGSDGKWRAGSYIPAYVRRYPFILISGPQPDLLSLGADLTATSFNQSGTGLAIYDNGAPSETAKRALQFCLAYQQAALATGQICRAMEAAGLLVERSADFTLPQGNSRVSGFKIVDEQAFNTLSDEAFLKLRKAGALPAINMHLLSMKSWRNLLG